MEDQLLRALQQLSQSSFYKVVYEEYIIPEMRKLLLLEEFDLSTSAEDIKLDNLARLKSFKTLEAIFDKINALNVPDQKIVEQDKMI